MSYDISKWQNGSEGFWRFVEDVGPRHLDENEKFVPFTCNDEDLRAEISAAIDSEAKTVGFVWPRRHGKSLICALIIVWKFVTRLNQNIAIVSNSEKQAVSTCYRYVRDCLTHTPFTKALIDAGSIRVKQEAILYAAANSNITALPNNARTLWGGKFTVAQRSELGNAADASTYNTLLGSVLDTKEGIVLVDSVAGAEDSPLRPIYDAWKGGEPGICISYIHYKDIEDAVKRQPKWISEAGLRSLAATMLPLEFAAQHLNQWTEGERALFPKEVRAQCKDTYSFNPSEIAGLRKFVVGGGLDRALGFSKHGDSTITTAVLKVNIDEKDHYFVLDSHKVAFSSGSGIREAFNRYHKDFGMSHCTLEVYGAQDIAAWCAEQPFDSEVIHPTTDRQASAFTELYNIASEGRLHIHAKFARLFEEMATFEYRLDTDKGGRGVVPKFGHARGKHDDTVYSLAWAIYSLRNSELNPFEVDSINCDQTGPTVPLCVLNGGEHVLPCAETCKSFQNVAKLFNLYQQKPDFNPLSIGDFYKYKVTNVGAHTKRR